MRIVSLLLVFSVFCKLLSAQGFDRYERHLNRKVDSIKYYQKELIAINKAYRDSLNNDPEYKDILGNFRRLSAVSDNYRAFSIYTSMSSVNFDKFNSDNAVSGFGAFSERAFSIGYGFSFKKNRGIFDINVGAFGLNKKIEKDQESIRTSFTTFLQFEYGYDFVRSNMINIYPYAGVGLRSSSLKYTGITTVNTNYSNITNIIQNNNSVDKAATELGYQAGIGFEFVLSKRSSSGGALVFVKAGTNGAFSRKQFDIEGLKYDPKFNYGAWTVTAGFKFFGR